MRYLFLLLMCVFSVSGQLIAQEANKGLLKQVAICSNPADVVTPRFNSLGGANPAVIQDSGGFNGSPTAIASLVSLQSTTSYSELICDRGSRVFNFAFPSKLKLPLKNMSLGFMFQTDMFRDTALLTGLRNQSIIGVGLNAESPIQIPVFKQSNIGLTLKGILQETTLEERFLPAIDLGFYARYGLNLPDFFVKLPSHVDLGLALTNFTSTPKAESTTDPWLNLEVPSGFSVGARMPILFDGFYQSLMLKSAGEHTEYGVASEWFYNKRLSFTGSFILDSEDKKAADFASEAFNAQSFKYINSSRVNFGLGYNFDRLPSINFYPSRGRFDVSYSSLTDGSDQEIRFGLTLLGKAQDSVPVIEYPKNDQRISAATVTVKGKSSPYSTVTLFKNTLQARQVETDSNGNWIVEELELNEGVNKIFASSSSTNNESSDPSEPIKVIKDTEKPEVNFIVSRTGSELEVIIQSEEDLASVSYQGDFGWEELERVGEKSFKLSYPLERGLGNVFEDSMLIQLEDIAQNQHFITLNPLVVRLEKPKDKEVLYVEKSLLTAKFSPLLKNLSINGENVPLSKTGGLIHTLSLNPGKNLIYFDMVLYPENIMEASYRVLVVKRFSDISLEDENRQQLEILATLGYIQEKEDNRFEPESPLTRIDVVHWMASFLKLSAPIISEDIFLDVSKDNRDASMIKAIVDEGVLLPFPDGTFRPNQAVTVTQAYRIFRDLDLLPPERLLISNDLITRRAFAMIFTELPVYTRDSTDLFNWEKGFN